MYEQKAQRECDVKFWIKFDENLCLKQVKLTK